MTSKEVKWWESVCITPDELVKRMRKDGNLVTLWTGNVLKQTKVSVVEMSDDDRVIIDTVSWAVYDAYHEILEATAFEDHCISEETPEDH